MALLVPSWYCVSLHTGCIICATCSIILYALAISLELWWIIESEVNLPLEADVLCAVYIIHLIVAIFLAIGLAGKKTRILLSCLVILSIFYFIEGALVLYMVIMYWTLENKYGIIELGLWIVRALYNVIVFITIMSQYATWRDEKQVMMRLQCLSLNGNSVVTGPSSSSVVMKKDGLHSNGHISVINIDHNQHAYDNPAYTTTTSDLTLNTTNKQHGSVVSVTFAPDGRMKRSLSSASQIRLHRAPSLYGGSLPSHGQELNDPMVQQQLHTHNPLAMSYGGSTKSEFDASSFSGIFSFPVRSQSELSLNFQGRTKGGGGGGMRENILGHKPRSLMYLDEDDYLARPPPSRPVSMGYVNVHREFSTQSLDRSKNNRKGSPRRAASLEALDVSELPEVKLQKMAMRPFDYLNRPGSKPSDLNIDSEDVRKIQDVAL